jgi:hypothetical protein
VGGFVQAASRRGLALVLTVSGLFSVLSYVVERTVASILDEPEVTGERSSYSL